MKLLKNIIKYISEYRLSQNEIQIKRLQKAIKKNEYLIYDMQAATSKDDCYSDPSCVFGREYTELTDKLKRQRNWLEVLIKRRNK